jgi:hypothetical protein
MPFQSEKQRKYLWANEPEIARDWTDKYGSRVKKQEGGGFWKGLGIPSVDLNTLASKYVLPSSHFSSGDYDRIYNTATNTPDYHADATENLFDHLYTNYENIPYVGGAAAMGIEKLAPYIALGASPIYDFAQAKSEYAEDPAKYQGSKWDKINAYFPDLANTNVSGILNAFDQQDPWSAMWNRARGATTGALKRKIDRQNQIQELFGKGWDAIKNEFGGSAEAATLGDLIQRRSQASQAPQSRDTWNQYQLTEHGPFGGPFGYLGFTKDALDNQDFSMDNLIMGGEYVPGADLNKAYRLMMNEKMRSYGEDETIPNKKYEGLEIKRNYIPTGELPLHIGPYKKHSRSASNKPIYKTVGFNQDGSRFMTKAEYDNLNLNEDDPYVHRIPDRIRGVPRSIPRNMGMLERFRNKFYKPAAGAINYGGRTYSPAQLNSMNALGGYYSEPARQQRRLDARRTNILNRAAKGKPVGNVNKLLGKYGYSGTPGSGTLQFTGQHEGSSTAGAGYSRSDDSWSSSPFRRGGLASLWQR